MRTYSSLSEAIQASDRRNERPFRCHMHNDRHASASVNMSKAVWYCYTCGAHGRLDYVPDPELDLVELDELLEEPREQSERMLAMYCAGPVHPYWLSRFSETACRHFQLGYDPNSRRPCYPMRDQFGRLLGIVTRNLDDLGPKYRYPRKVKKSELLFNYDRYAEISTVVLAEGAMDVIACWEAGFDALGIYGSSLSDGQVQLLRCLAPDRVVLAFDNDTAGRKCAREAAAALREFEVLSVSWDQWDKWGDDIAELPVETRTDLLHSLAL